GAECVATEVPCENVGCPSREYGQGWQRDAGNLVQAVDDLGYGPVAPKHAKHRVLGAMAHYELGRLSRAGGPARADRRTEEGSNGLKSDGGGGSTTHNGENRRARLRTP